MRVEIFPRPVERNDVEKLTAFQVKGDPGKIEQKLKRLGKVYVDGFLNQSQGGIYIDTGLGSAANTVIPANAGIQGTVENVLSCTPAYAGVTKVFAHSGCTIQQMPIAEADSGVWLNVGFTLVLV